MTDVTDPGIDYLAYLLRLRRDDSTAPWRVTIEDPHTGERRGFATLKQFVVYLEKQTGEVICPSNLDKPKSTNN